VFFVLIFILDTSCIFWIFTNSQVSNLNLLEVFSLVNPLYTFNYTGSFFRFFQAKREICPLLFLSICEGSAWNLMKGGDYAGKKRETLNQLSAGYVKGIGSAGDQKPYDHFRVGKAICRKGSRYRRTAAAFFLLLKVLMNIAHEGTQDQFDQMLNEAVTLGSPNIC